MTGLAFIHLLLKLHVLVFFCIFFSGQTYLHSLWLWWIFIIKLRVDTLSNVDLLIDMAILLVIFSTVISLPINVIGWYYLLYKEIKFRWIIKGRHISFIL